MGKKSQFFRANTGAVICNRQGLILSLERSDMPDAWQLPQGGMDKGETPRETVMREIEEETGLSADALSYLGAYPELLAYELPAAMRTGKTGRGQVQYWFYFLTDAPEPELGKEFRAYQWLPFDALVERVVEFRQPLYQKLAEHFASVISPALNH